MRYVKLLLILPLLILLSCNQGNKSAEDLLSTDVVENSASATGNPAEKSEPKITFEKTEHEFGRLADGEKVEYSFKFTNTGNADLLISNCYGSCGCTVPEWPDKPVPPGEDGVIKVSFDSKGRPGMNNKTVTVLANTSPRSTVIRISAEVTRN